MYMNGEYLSSLRDLKRCFSIDELLYSYSNGELEIFLDKIGEHCMAEKIRNISCSNAMLLVELYKILGLNPNDSEEEIRRKFS